MTISGFSFVRNGSLLYLPYIQSMQSILPICDEFVMAVGRGDEDDETLEQLEALREPKLQLVHTEWDSLRFPKNTVFAVETDKAKVHCKGDWLFYIQGDEAVHERYLETIKQACEAYVDDPQVEGFLFKYKHFWGDYHHVHRDHGWYNREIRIIRNSPQIRSWRDAQGFRFYDEFESSFEGYSTKDGNRKLRVIELDAYVYHYGFVRPPDYMQRKSKRNRDTYLGTTESVTAEPAPFDYGNLSELPLFKESHPAVMDEWIAKFNWADQLQYESATYPEIKRRKHKHERLKNKVLTWIETRLLGGHQILTRKNFVRIGTHLNK